MLDKKVCLIGACVGILSGIVVVNQNSELIKATNTIGTTKGYVTPLFNSKDFEISNRALAPNTKWAIGKRIEYNQDTLYQVATNEYVRSQDIQLDSNKNSQVSNDNSIVGTVTSKSMFLYDDRTGKKITNRILACGSKWIVGKIYQNNEGQKYYQVSTHEYAKDDDMYLNSNSYNVTSNSIFDDKTLSDGNIKNSNNNDNSSSQLAGDNNINTSSNEQNNYGQTVPEPDINEVQNDIKKIVNKERTSVGVNQLQTNDILQKASEIRAKDQVKLYGHIRPDGERWDAVFNPEETDIYYAEADSENAIIVSNSFHNMTAEKMAEMAMSGFNSSTPHYQAIISPDYTEFGIGVYKDPNSVRYYVIQIFAKPRED